MLIYATCKSKYSKIQEKLGPCAPQFEVEPGERAEIGDRDTITFRDIGGSSRARPGPESPDPARTGQGG
eukprot:2548873-Prymnesium_polylepis.1